MSKIFFYGLFMDRALLAGKGLHPEIVGPAVLPDWRIHIGERATLLRSASSRTFGIVMELADEEVRALYSEPSVSEYIRERVEVELLSPLFASTYRNAYGWSSWTRAKPWRRTATTSRPRQAWPERIPHTRFGGDS